MSPSRQSHRGPANKNSWPPVPKAKGPSPIPSKDPNAFPMRINKYLALKGYAARRDADRLIAKKIVTINGNIAVLGDKVAETDIVEVRRNKQTDPSRYVYYACHKPAGITVLETRKGQLGFANALPIKETFPVGSLDKDASGLVIFTNDRRIIDRLENPAHAHPKQYLMQSRIPLRENFKEKLEAGVSIAGGPLIMSRVAVRSPNSAVITTDDPGNHIRQICSLFGAETSSLTRTAILNVKLGNLPPNGFRRIEDDELAAFLKSLGL